MALPKKLKMMNLFNEGNSYLGQTGEVTLPKLGRKLEAWRGGGMDGSIKWDAGMSDDMIEFAEEITQSGLNFHDLEPRIKRYLEDGHLIFNALQKAIERERFHLWREDIIDRAINENGVFINSIKKMNLTANESYRVQKVYAVCIASFINPPDRKMMEPKICGDIDDYKKPRHIRHPVSVRINHHSREAIHLMAYRSLLDEARRVADQYILNTFERVVMAKCIAEQSLRFIPPSHNPFKALHKHHLLEKKAPEDAFFMNTGVCSNFSGIAYNAALELGLSGKIHLAKHGVHVYLEFRDRGEWFHAHPFNSKSKCDITRFKRIEHPSPPSEIIPNEFHYEWPDPF